MKMAWAVFKLGAACVGLVLVSLLCAYAWPESDYGMAAWIQAFGSVAAIFVALYVMNSQHREAERKEKERGRALIRLALDIANTATNAIGQLDTFRSGPGTLETLSDRKRQYTRLAQILENAKALPLASLPSTASARNVIVILTEVSDSLQKIHGASERSEELKGCPEYGEPFRPHWNTLREVGELLADELKGGTGYPPGWED